MASPRVMLALLAALVAIVPLARAKFTLECHMIPVYDCAFSVSTLAHRCVLEKAFGSDDLVCLTSDIMVGLDAPVEYIETDTCITDCGLDRLTVGFSTDELNSERFISSVCSQACRENCPNIEDLYSNIVAGEGFTMQEFCGLTRRSMLMGSRLLVAEAPM